MKNRQEKKKKKIPRGAVRSCKTENFGRKSLIQILEYHHGQVRERERERVTNIDIKRRTERERVRETEKDMDKERERK